jgi:hypothetical protein
VLDLAWAVTGVQSGCARKALKPRVVKGRTPRSPTYDGRVVAVLERYRVAVIVPTGKLLARIPASWCRLLSARPVGHEE